MREVLRNPVRHRPDGGEHRALGGVADRLVRGIGRAGKRGRHEHGIDQLARPRDQLRRRAAHDLRQDHAAVSARSEQSRSRHRVDDRLAPDHIDRLAVHAVELVEYRAHGHGHVVAGVAIGDREHVEVVDLLTARLELRVRGRYCAAESNEARVRHGQVLHRHAGQVPSERRNRPRPRRARRPS